MPPSPRQAPYLASLVLERTATLTALAASPDRTTAAKATFLLGPNTSSLDVRAASEAISWLLDSVQPDQARPTAPAAPAVDVPAGRYAIVASDGTVKFYRVDRPTEGRWAGYTFVKVQASDEWHRVPRPAQAGILQAIAADPMGAMQRYGLELGRCGNCGRTLTDETSRAMGIGPDCADYLGLDRSPYAEAARREMADRITGRSREREERTEALAARLHISHEEAALEVAIEEAEAADAVRGEQEHIDRMEAEYNAAFARREREAEEAAFLAGMRAEMLDTDDLQAEEV